MGNSLCDHRRFGSAWRSTLQFGGVGGGSQFWWLFDIVDNATASYWYAAGGHTIPGESPVTAKDFVCFSTTYSPITECWLDQFGW